MNRIRNLEQYIISTTIAGMMTLGIIAQLKDIFSPAEIIVFWIATKMVLTYSVWSLIIVWERYKEKAVSAEVKRIFRVIKTRKAA